MNLDRKSIKAILFLVFCTVVLFWGFQNLDDISKAFNSFVDIIKPFILGGAIAFVVNVPMKRIEGNLFSKSEKLKKAKRPVAYLITLVGIVILLALAMFVIIPQIAATIEKLALQIPPAYNATREYIS